MTEFGDLSGIVFNVRTGQLVSGHQRRDGIRKKFGNLPVIREGERAWILLPGGKRFEIRMVDWDLPTQRAANIAANNPHIAGHFTSRLQPQLDEIRARSEELFKGLRMHPMLAKRAKIGKTDPDDVQPAPANSRIKPGDIFLLWKHRLACGDVTDMAAVESLMDGKLADFIVTDPPYNVAYEGKTSAALTTQNDKMSDSLFAKFLRKAYDAYFSSCRPGAAIYVFHADMEGANFRTQLQESGFLFKQVCIWVKDVFVLGRQDFQWQHEPILYGWKEGAAHTWHSDRKQTTIWEFPRPTKSTDHPTMKPVALISYPIECSSKAGDLGIDFFGGSGSTLIACESLDRTCYTMEIDPKYCDVIISRWEAFTGKKAKLAEKV